MNSINTRKISDLVSEFPFLISFFNDNGLEISGREELNLSEYFATFDREEIEDRAINPENLIMQIDNFIRQMISFIGGKDDVVKTVTILPGRDKSLNREKFDKLVIGQGEIISVVGPTGSGKSRLLADIEWVAQGDTPTGRSILINNTIPDKKWRFSSADKLVAQLSQNMNFVMDLSVCEFVEMHAESRMIENRKQVVERIIEKANSLAGESFAPETPITSLSGGQSRALMIADTAILSKSPIILIDEIENAGIDRKKALSLLLSEEKIVLMATHDPVLALMGDRRIVVKNGGIYKIIETTDEERSILSTLESMDRIMLAYRTKLRRGEIITKIAIDSGNLIPAGESQ